MTDDQYAVLQDMLNEAGCGIQNRDELISLLAICKELLEQRRRISKRYDPFKYAVGINEYRQYFNGTTLDLDEDI